MAPIDVTFDLPANIAAGLADNILFRNGGVIQDNAGQVVAWLREVAGAEQIGAVSQAEEATSAMSLIGAGSMLTMGASVLGFTVIYAKLKEIEGQLKEFQKAMEDIDEKIDMSFYANFRAALDLVRNAFSMSEESNRQNSALQAINRFLEAEHIYSDMLNKHLEYQSPICGEYLLTLYLAYLAEVRCYLELGEYDTALRRFKEGKTQIQQYAKTYINILLTERPIIYLYPQTMGSVDLSRLTKIYQWKDSSLNESAVFELMRNFFLTPVNMLEEMINSLPPAVIEPWKIKKGFWGISDEGIKAVFKKLPQVIDEMESVIETSNRFAAYEFELQLISRTEITFTQWESLKPKQLAAEGVSMMYIIPPNPVKLETTAHAETTIRT
ncbi:hypothetical protein PGN35_018365 [Nodosilinea sp. PGN35]|uniref:hypothetical protein n=1 Tax=Nodosilinea sp. PGN35 TaxID=3020489 RepID=UPI0023B33665|nr:hypothetical protein [Nodosilinea sp. TSF1-S3]MDF0364706.1 hypothetical protein [Nodosilinea sp. TSF1-S3]